MYSEVTINQISANNVTYDSENLANNKVNFINRLWRKLFKIKLDYMRYDVTVDDKPLKALRREDHLKDKFNDYLNVSETRSLERISLATKAEVEAIAEEIFKYFDASKKIVYSKGANHPGNYTVGETHSVSSNDQCGVNFGSR